MFFSSEGVQVSKFLDTRFSQSWRHACHGFGVCFPHLEVAEFGETGWRKVFCCKVSWTFEIQHPKYSELMLFPTIKPRKEVESRPFASWLRKGNGPDFIIWFRVKHVAKLSICWFELTDFYDYVFLCELKDEKSPIFQFRGRLWTLRDFALQHSNWDSFTDKGKLRVWLPDLKKHLQNMILGSSKTSFQLSCLKNLGGLYHCYLLTFPWHGFHMFHFWFTALQWRGDWENPGIKLSSWNELKKKR